MRENPRKERREGGREDGDVSVMFRVAGRASDGASGQGRERSAGSGKVSRSISPASRAPQTILILSNHRLGDCFIIDITKSTQN